MIPTPECPKCNKLLDEELDDKLGSTDLLPGNHVSIYCGDCDWRLVVTARVKVKYTVEAIDAPALAKQ